ncbi:MAG: hypothetical protein JW725_04120 [Candidatus Babeliaceae bacterium]|nr:hypothetical protein [Candidatus Babeliaceae bacterium]
MLTKKRILTLFTLFVVTQSVTPPTRAELFRGDSYALLAGSFAAYYAANLVLLPKLFNWATEYKPEKKEGKNQESISMLPFRPKDDFLHYADTNIKKARPYFKEGGVSGYQLAQHIDDFKKNHPGEMMHKEHLEDLLKKKKNLPYFDTYNKALGFMFKTCDDTSKETNNAAVKFHQEEFAPLDSYITTCRELPSILLSLAGLALFYKSPKYLLMWEGGRHIFDLVTAVDRASDKWQSGKFTWYSLVIPTLTGMFGGYGLQKTFDGLGIRSAQNITGIVVLPRLLSFTHDQVVKSKDYGALNTLLGKNKLFKNFAQTTSWAMKCWAS